MTSNVFRIVAIVGSLALAGLGGAVVALGGDGDGSGPGAFLRAHFGHQAGGHGHHGGHFGHGGHEHFAQLLADLDLSEEQHRHLETIHEIFGSQHAVTERVHEELMQWTITRVEQDDLTSDQIRELVDQHLERIRAVAYEIGDEAAAFAASLDGEQRQVLTEHLREAQAR